MKVILFGATGMVGQGVLRECRLDRDVETVLTVGRSSTGQQHTKLQEIISPDLFDLSPIESRLAGYDACFFCLGVSAAGMKEDDYRRLTYDLTMSVARTLVRLNPGMTFIYVSGAGTDSSERGRMMWARVKGKTENDLLKMPFRAAYMFRPGYIQPLHGIRTKTKWYGALYAVMGPLYPLWKRLLPNYVTTTECVGRAMIRVARQGAPKRFLENRDINSLCGL
ncbi:MAG TPA: epimerase [Candidatus Angelobacter sp.]